MSRSERAVACICKVRQRVAAQGPLLARALRVGATRVLSKHLLVLRIRLARWRSARRTTHAPAARTTRRAPPPILLLLLLRRLLLLVR